jgi:hypothetical protein
MGFPTNNLYAFLGSHLHPQALVAFGMHEGASCCVNIVKTDVMQFDVPYLSKLPLVIFSCLYKRIAILKFLSFIALKLQSSYLRLCNLMTRED